MESRHGTPLTRGGLSTRQHSWTTYNFGRIEVLRSLRVKAEVQEKIGGKKSSEKQKKSKRGKRKIRCLPELLALACDSKE
jgi:hypothetical protein